MTPPKHTVPLYAQMPAKLANRRSSYRARGTEGTEKRKRTGLESATTKTREKLKAEKEKSPTSKTKGGAPDVMSLGACATPVLGHTTPLRRIYPWRESVFHPIADSQGAH